MTLIYLKRKPRIDPRKKVSLKAFLRSVLGQFCSDLNGLLSDYRSVQEHGCRNQIIDFLGQAVSNFELLYTVVRGAYLLRDLRITTLKQYDCEEQGAQLVEMADYTAGMFGNMKLSFIPKHDFTTALATAVAPDSLFVMHKDKDQLIENIDFTEINRLIKIYLIKEDISRYYIRDGLLYIPSEYFLFKLALCGDYLNPSWMIVSANILGGGSALEQAIIARVPPTIAHVCRFVRFYESRRHARELFEFFGEEAVGFNRSFTATRNGNTIACRVENNDFICTVSDGQSTQTLINASPNEIIRIIQAGPSRMEEDERTSREFIENYKVDQFGDNYTVSVDDVLLVFSKSRPTFRMGKSCVNPSQFHRGMLLIKGNAYIAHISDSGKAAGISRGICAVDALADAFDRDVAFLPAGEYAGESQPEGEPTALRRIEQFIRENRQCFAILLEVARFGPVCVGMGKIIASQFQIRPGFQLAYSVDQECSSTQKVEQFTSREMADVINKAALIAFQHSPPFGLTLIESRPAERAIFEVHKIRVMLSSQVKTPIKALTDDCKQFLFYDALKFICNFGHIYRLRLCPTISTISSLTFDLSYLSAEFVRVFREGDCCRISGAKTAKLLKISRTFTDEDANTLGLLKRAFIINRFAYIKKLFGQDGPNRNLIEFQNGSQIILSLEGIKFCSVDGKNDDKLTQILNEERDITPCLKIAVRQ